MDAPTEKFALFFDDSTHNFTNPSTRISWREICPNVLPILVSKPIGDKVSYTTYAQKQIKLIGLDLFKGLGGSPRKDAGLCIKCIAYYTNFVKTQHENLVALIFDFDLTLSMHEGLDPECLISLVLLKILGEVAEGDSQHHDVVNKMTSVIEKYKQYPKDINKVLIPYNEKKKLNDEKNNTMTHFMQFGENNMPKLEVVETEFVKVGRLDLFKDLLAEIIFGLARIDDLMQLFQASANNNIPIFILTSAKNPNLQCKILTFLGFPGINACISIGSKEIVMCNRSDEVKLDDPSRCQNDTFHNWNPEWADPPQSQKTSKLKYGVIKSIIEKCIGIKCSELENKIVVSDTLRTCSLFQN